jgi:hypothetical protein
MAKTGNRSHPRRTIDLPACHAAILMAQHLAAVLNLTTASTYQDPYRALQRARRALLPLTGISVEVDEVLAVLDPANGPWGDPERVRARMLRRVRAIRALGRSA